MSEIKPVLPPGSLYQELASLTRRVLFTNGRLGARAAREFAPFPARALRDRPWDISALVE